MQTARVYEPLHNNEFRHSQLKTVDSRQRGVDREGEVGDLEQDGWLGSLMIIAFLMFIGWHMV